MARATSSAVAVPIAALLVLWSSPSAAAEVTIGGYVKLDAIWSDKIAGGGNGSTAEVAGGPSAVPLDSQPQFDNGDFNLEARQTRLNVTGTAEVDRIKLRGFVESDFFTGEGNRNVSNSRGLRLRHAYAEATTPAGLFLLAGQTWSTFMNLATAPPDTIDFNGPAGQLFNREPQVRVGFRRSSVTVLGAVESHSVSGPDASTLNQSQELPLFVAKAIWDTEVLAVEVAGTATENRAVFGGADDSETAWGAQAGVKLTIGRLGLVGQVHWLDGLNRLANGDFVDAVSADGRIEHVETLGWYAGVSYALTRTTELNAVYGWAKADQSALYTGAVDERHQTVHVNVVQKLWERMQVGLEYQYAKREQFNGDEGDLNRVQAAWWFFF
jgi:hypothetical protein